MFLGTVLLNPKAIRAETSTKRHPLGTRGETIDGRVFRYAKAGEALSIAIPVTQAALYEQAKDSAMAANIVTTGAITTTHASISINTSDLTAAAKDYYADGFVVVNSDTNTLAMGQILHIKSNPQMTTSSTGIGTTGTVYFADDERLTVDIASGAVVTVHCNPYNAVIEHDGGTLAGGIVGVPLIAVTDTYYFWAQTWGPCPVQQDGTWIQGEQLISSTQSDQGLQSPVVAEVATTADTTLSYVMDSTNIQTQVGRAKIGWSMGSPGTDNKIGLVFLTISP